MCSSATALANNASKVAMVLISLTYTDIISEDCGISENVELE